MKNHLHHHNVIIHKIKEIHKQLSKLMDKY